MTEQCWEMLEKHERLQEYLTTVPKGLRVIRMTGTFIGATLGFHDAGANTAGGGSAQESADRHQTPEGIRGGLITQLVQHVYDEWETCRSIFLTGSSHQAVPIHDPVYPFYTYFFVSGLMWTLMEVLKEKEKKEEVDHLRISFTFVPEDILFAQFFFDDARVAMAPTVTIETKKEMTDEMYAALVYPPKEAPQLFDRRPPNTVTRMISIFDARYREQANRVGEESWVLRRVENNEFSAAVVTPFWRFRDSPLNPYEFRFSSPNDLRVHELGRNGVRLFFRDMVRRTGANFDKFESSIREYRKSVGEVKSGG